MDGVRRCRVRLAVAALSVIMLTGCASPRSGIESTQPSSTADSTPKSPASSPAQPSPAHASTSRTPAADPEQSLSAGDTTRPPSPPKDVVFTKDHHYYSSPWYDGAWQEMIGFGCTNAPYYSRDPTCPRSKPGKHHGIDTYMPCGTKVRSAVKGVVVPNPALGPAYGKHGLRIRHKKYDFVIGHARRLKVQPGEHVTKGQLIARSGKSGAPDGCHLHFEKRPAGRGYLSAVNPLKSLRRTVVRFTDG
jgi:murein DD-endopeptidase MepM/ murein hydrolase activator NlpD